MLEIIKPKTTRSIGRALASAIKRSAIFFPSLAYPIELTFDGDSPEPKLITKLIAEDAALGITEIEIKTTDKKLINQIRMALIGQK